MESREKLEAKLRDAAPALGLEVYKVVDTAEAGEQMYLRCLVRDKEGNLDRWMPHEDDGDSRRLEVACLKWMAEILPGNRSLARYDYVRIAFQSLERARLSGRLDAYRYLVLDLAAEIGKATKEKP